MAERSSTPPESSPFTRRRIIVGAILVAIVGGAIALGLARLRGEPDPGRLIYAVTGGVYERHLGSGDERKIGDLPSDVVVAAPSPDGEWIAYSRTAGDLWMLELGGDRRWKIADSASVPMGWTPGGELVAGEFLSDQDVVAIDPDGKRRVIASGRDVSSTPVWLSRDRFVAKSERGVPLTASADRSEVLFARSEDAVIAKVNGDDFGEPREVFDGRVSRAATSRQGNFAISGRDAAEEFGVWVLDAGGRSPRRVLDFAVDWLEWSRDGTRLIYSKEDAVFAVSAAGGTPRQLSRDGARVFPLFSFIVAAS